ncbi:pro-neuregulin-3, membrane-bound isoform [Manacus vitellinus]|uniref:pro-neuregulin-3, membrane-bound isoform n=1 Tax=Manacus vitellinus TaxID=328815 RepID=UPI000DF0DC08|nr:pro-neuregulin-3, membrane-bound isoform [Manacus vitellinus]
MRGSEKHPFLEELADPDLRASRICRSLAKTRRAETRFSPGLFSDAFLTLPFAVHRERGRVPAPGAVHFLHRLRHSRSGHALCSVLLQNKVNQESAGSVSNRRRVQTKQIHEQLKETQNRKTYSLNASSMMAKSECMAQSQVQLQNYSKPDRHPGPILHKVMESSFSGPQSFPEALSPDRGTQPIKQHRSLSSCCSPGQKSGMLHRNAFRRTPPLPRGRFNGITGPAYQQLEESRITDQDTIPCHGYSSSGLKTPQNTSINMQLPSRETTPYFNNVDQKDLVGYSSSRANSVPIIPSVGLDEACMQMQNVSEVTGIKWCKNSYSAELVNVSSPVSNCLIAEQHEVKVLLETVQEQIRILTDARRSEDYDLASADAESSASENTAFLPMSPLAKSEREAQFVLKNETQRDSVLTK